MRFTVVAVGKPRDAELAAAIQNFETRAARYWPLSFAEVREQSSRGRSVADVIAREGERLRAALPKGGSTWVCDCEGTMQTSEDFARWMQRSREAARDVAFVLGGAFGVDPSLKADAAGRLSLGRMTMSHELARLVLAEQLYRAGTIVRGEPYHK